MLLATIAIGFLLPCRAQDATPPAVAALPAHPVRQTKIADCEDATQPVFWEHSTTIRDTPDGDLTISGTDDRGKNWTALIPGGGVMKCEAWSASLWKHSRDALIFIVYGGSSSGGYDNVLTILFFDKNGRPVPWQAQAISNPQFRIPLTRESVRSCGWTRRGIRGSLFLLMREIATTALCM